ncbi:MAG: copper resistance protein NlpE [Melioribacteraceae bacterium]|nr:copper resistance protein NlpE [Melioribacteraceae bacterium]MCF8355593.1 copper resistance protein NlpE [Melioribacteraceae bacterium]MCF8395028.1 copper resistance protein NlpE [Melioribacteraceae bacterium]MCF8420482.1 copper resistance protein NlpE [Melioribacteraceae bacterium]
MKLLIAKISFILFIFIFNGCYTQVIKSNKSSGAQLTIPGNYISPSKINFEDHDSFTFLFQEWKHSSEEERDSVIIYRPGASINFPPTKFRGTIVFYQDGRFKYSAVNPSDAPFYKFGIWALNKNDKNIILLIYSNEKKSRIKLIELTQLGH